MAFQTSFLRDGEWVTETVNYQAALKQASAVPPRGTNTDPRLGPPVCGILSRTFVESPIVRRILAARLRSRSHNDVAFIGERFVNITELRSDGTIHEVARKNDFGSRIRSAVVLGDTLEHEYEDGNPAGTLVKSETLDLATPPNDTRNQPLPPQMLLLALDSGDCIFLFLRERPRSPPEFAFVKHVVPRTVPYLGYHLAVDPSSRYVAAASPDGILVVYELEAKATLNAQHMSRGSFDPIKSFRFRSIQGVIHKLDFLCPQPEDDCHIILVMIVIGKEKNSNEPVARMITYEWEAGESLREVFASQKTGNRLPKEHKTPLLLIPLKFGAAFFTVSESSIGIVKHCLSGSPVFESLRTDPPSQTRLYHGADSPLWASWARPFRRRKYFEKTDIIYLAREDGAIIHIEIEASDLVPSVTNVGCLDANVDTAFATAYDIFSDILIIGGDSGPGGIWKLAPRTDLEQVSSLPNWSPVVDVTTVTGFPMKATPTSGVRGDAGKRHNSTATLVKPDTLFTASGRGLKGSVTQWRWGIQGRIALDIESGEPIRQSWTLPVDDHEGGGLHALLALPHSSAILRFSEDFSRVDALSAADTYFDVSCRTLGVYQTAKRLTIQVTEKSIALIKGSESERFPLDKVLSYDGIAADCVFSSDNLIVLSTHGSLGSRLHTLSISSKGVSHGNSWEAHGETTCLSTFRASGNNFVVAGSVLDGVPWVSVYSLDGEIVATKAIAEKPARADDAGTGTQLEPPTSIYVVGQDEEAAYFVAGTRCGHLLNMRVTDRGSSRITWGVETIGVAPVDVFPCSDSFDGGTAALMCCDHNLIMMTDLSMSEGKFRRKHVIYLTDANDASMSSPPVHSARCLDQSLSAYAGHLTLMVQTGSRLLIAEIWPHIGLIPRAISVEGTPTRIIYSATWNCLVVGLLKGNKPTLAFVDSDTGEMISVPSDKDRNPSEFISGLGHAGDRIYGLHEWLYVKDGKTFSFILVTTKDGRLLIVSVNRLKSRRGEVRSRRLQYWTRYKKVLGQPIYSVTSDDQGIVFCVDKTIRWEILDLTEKKLKLVKEHELDSPATSLLVDEGKIFALTTLHSLEVVDYNSSADGEGMSLVHSDQVSRRTVHMMDAGDPLDRRGGWPISLLADQDGGIAGVWVPRRQRNKEFELVFEGILPTAVRRFARARSRPPWLAAGRRHGFGTLPSSADGADLLGVSLDGSLQHFTLIGLELWRFLGLVQNMARKQASQQRLAEGMYSGVGGAEDAGDEAGGDAEKEADGADNDNEEDDIDDSEASKNRRRGEGQADDDESMGLLEVREHPRSMHIDGDVLEGCLKRRDLEKFVRKSNEFFLFHSHLDGLEGGRLTEGFREKVMAEHERRARYLQLGYEILEHVLEPVL